MASQNERLRWEQWFEATNARMRRQKKAIDRLLVANTEQAAALHEIAGSDVAQKPDGTDCQHCTGMKERAQQALDRVSDLAAAAAQTKEELEAEGEPEDPRRRH